MKEIQVFSLRAVYVRFMFLFAGVHGFAIRASLLHCIIRDYSHFSFNCHIISTSLAVDDIDSFVSFSRNSYLCDAEIVTSCIKKLFCIIIFT